MGSKSWFVDSDIIALGSADQGFNWIHDFQSLHLHRQGGLNKKEIELILCKIFSTLIFNEVCLLA